MLPMNVKQGETGPLVYGLIYSSQCLVSRLTVIAKNLEIMILFGKLILTNIWQKAQEKAVLTSHRDFISLVG